MFPSERGIHIIYIYIYIYYFFVCFIFIYFLLDLSLPIQWEKYEKTFLYPNHTFHIQTLFFYMFTLVVGIEGTVWGQGKERVGGRGALST